jgi:hypothetical protein
LNDSSKLTEAHIFLVKIRTLAIVLPMTRNLVSEFVKWTNDADSQHTLSLTNAMNRSASALLPPRVSAQNLRTVMGDLRAISGSEDSDSDSGADGALHHARARNRRAVQKWRQKKQHYLSELEATNDALRRQALELATQLECTGIANEVLSRELGFFQSLTAAIMQGNA